MVLRGRTSLFTIFAAGLGVVAIATFFSGVAVFWDYQHYLSDYRQKQTAEFIRIRKKIDLFLKTFQEITSLTSANLRAFHHDPKAIQNILGSLPFLRLETGLPPFQEARYFRLSTSQLIITRLGSTPSKIPEELLLLKNSSFSCDQRAVTAALPIINGSGKISGIFELKISAAALKIFLGLPSALADAQINPQVQRDLSSPLLLKDFFLLIAYPPLTPGAFLKLHYDHYVLFFACAFACLLFLAFFAARIHLIFKTRNRLEVRNLKDALQESLSSAEATRNALDQYMEELQATRSALESYRRVHGDIVHTQQQQEEAFRQSARIIQRDINNALPQDPEVERIEILKTCIKTIYMITHAFVAPLKEAPISLLKVLEEIIRLFGDRIYKLSLTIALPPSEPSTEEIFSFRGDPIFIELLLINLVGKAIYRLPKKGKLSLHLQMKEDKFYLRIEDNGYSPEEITEHFPQKSLAFFLKDAVFRQLCFENGIKYEISQLANGLNVSQLIIPSTPLLVEAHNNVFQLFP